MATNPVLTKLDKPDGNGYASKSMPSGVSGQGFAGEGSASQGWASRGFDTRPTASGRYMTLDDVIVRTAAMLGIIFLAGGFSWVMASSSIAWPLALAGMIGGFGLGLYMSFTGKANALTALVYAACEGLFLGAISRAFEQVYAGIVVQAITGTAMVAGGMLFVYKIGAIRVTPRFWRVTTAAMIGVLGLMLVNLVASFFTSGGLGLRGNGTLAIVFSLVCIVVAAMSLMLDFDMVEQAIRRGTDEKFAWYCAFGLMVTLVWLYLEIVRLLGSLRD